LKGEAQGRSDAQASAGSAVCVAQEVAKPRTRPGRRRDPLPRHEAAGLDCVVGQEKSRRGSVVRPAGQPAGRHGFPVRNSEEECKSKEGRLTPWRQADASAECPQDEERRTGRMEPIPILGCRIRVLEGPHNLMRVGGRRPQGCRPDHPEPQDSGGPRRSGGSTPSSGFVSTDERTRSPIANRLAPVPGNRPGICCCVANEGHGSPADTICVPARVRQSHTPALRSDERGAVIVGR
jgi:hypothetical protein